MIPVAALVNTYFSISAWQMMLRKEVAEPDVSFTEDHDGAHADTIVLPEEVAKGPELESPAADQKEPNGIDVTETKQPAVKGFFDRAETHAGGQNGTSQRASLDSSQGLQEPLLQGSHEVGSSLALLHMKRSSKI